jgi:hypothetical protein
MAANEITGAIRTWLMKAPRPELLRVYARDGREFDVTIEQGTAWIETANSVAALDPEKLEATAGDGRLLRACLVADLIKKEATQEQQRQATHTAMTATDPETQRLIVFAELLERAHQRSTDAIEHTVNVAFTQLQEICSSLAAQATAAHASANELSVAIRTLMIQQAQELVEHANAETTPPASPLEQFASNFLSGKAAADAEAAHASTNGAAAAPKGKAKANGKAS